jgi:hypothetical protein
LEVLLALGILGSILLVAHALIFSTLASRERIQAAGDPSLSAQSLGWLFREDLHGTVGSALAEGSFEGAAPGGFSGPGELLSMVTAAHHRPQLAATGLLLVSYRLRRSSEDPKAWDLLRSEVSWKNGPVGDKRYETLFRKLRSFDVRYFSGSEWSRSWPVQRGVPAAVKLVLKSVPLGDEEPDRYETMVWIPAGSASAKTGGGP